MAGQFTALWIDQGERPITGEGPLDQTVQDLLEELLQMPS